MAKLVSIEDPDNHSHFLNYATKLYNDIPMQIREIENYKQVVLKLKKYLFDKSLARSLSS